MILLPAIDLIGGKAVRLLHGDYAQMTVYHDHPVEVAKDFAAAGASWIHMVDLEGARDGGTPNLPVIESVARETGLRVEVGGGIRSMEIIRRYMDAGVARVVLGTAAVENRALVQEAAALYGEAIAVGMDLRDGMVATRGWLETTAVTASDMMRRLLEDGVRTVIVTDISRDGAMRGTNVPLYESLQAQYDIRVVASGGVSSMADVQALRAANVYGAIIGKAYYTGAIDLSKALEAAK